MLWSLLILVESYGFYWFIFKLFNSTPICVAVNWRWILWDVGVPASSTFFRPSPLHRKKKKKKPWKSPTASFSLAESDSPKTFQPNVLRPPCSLAHLFIPHYLFAYNQRKKPQTLKPHLPLPNQYSPAATSMKNLSKIFFFFTNASKPYLLVVSPSSFSFEIPIWGMRGFK